MPVSHRVDAERKLVITTLEGVVTTEELLQNSTAMYANREIDGCTLELVDLSLARGDEISTGGIRTTAGNLQRATRIQQMAVFATNDLQYGLARMFQLLASRSQVQVEVFRDRARALRWLGIEPE